MSDLNAQLLAAHDSDDKTTLVSLYICAADQDDDIDASCFFLTHAYIFALEIADPRASMLRQKLASHGRETPVN